jgi:polysaccharide export outer membrane protein
MLKSRVLGLALACAIVASCGSRQPVATAPGIQLVQASEMPRPPADPDVVQRLDKLQVTVFGVPDLSRQLQVSAAGSFELPLIGAVAASGRTPSEIASEIEDRLRGPFLQNPEVVVETIERPNRLITVGGEVREPGQYPVRESVTLLEAVAIGGGPSEFAQMDDVLIFRTLNGERYIGVYNLRGIQRGNYLDPQVYPSDIIMVGDSTTRRRLNRIIGLSPLLTTPVILLERLLR